LADGDVQRRLQALGILQAARTTLDTGTWIKRQLFVGDLIDQILAVPPETIT